MEDLFYIKNVLMLLSAAVMIVTLFKALRLSPVLGYFAAGTIIGQHGMSLINEGTGMEIFAELGIVFLLFVIGLELTLDRLKAIKAYIMAGGLQVTITCFVIAILLYFMGQIPKSAAIISSGLCLSSTAIVLQVLKENGIQSTKIGRMSVAMLLTQDFVVVPLLVLVPHLSKNSSGVSMSSTLLLIFFKASIGLIIVFLAGRIFFRPIFNIIAYFESDELFIATTILVVLGSAFATEKVGLSMALGAFVAGLAIAETTYRHDVEKVVFPFKALLLGLFFMTVGMSLDVWELIQKLPKITIFVVGIIFIKATIIFIIARIFGFSNKAALHVGLLLSQGGEFAFILFNLSLKQGLLDPKIAQILMISVTVTMAITPLLNAIGEKINSISEEDQNIESLLKEEFETDRHVVIIGFSKIAKILVDTLIEEGIDYAILEINPDVVIKYKKEGYSIYYGNASDQIALKKINIANAIATIITIKNEITIKKCISVIQEHAPKTKIVIRSHSIEDIEKYKKTNIFYLMPIHHEEALILTKIILKFYGYTDAAISGLRKSLPIQDSISSDESC